MGVPGLWPALASAGVDRTLAELAWAHWDGPNGTHAPLRLGIDASLWLFHARKAQGGRNPALRALFFRLARLLRLPVVPVFVLDGAQRPAFKRDAAVYTGTHAIQAQFCAMLDAFRFPHWTAPGEAEAELAWMNRAGLVDAVLTDDVDALLFGARVVVRNHAWRDDDPVDDTDDDDAVVRAAVYDTRRGTWALDADGMVLVAVLAGADYDTRGMLHCGVKTAVGLAEAGLGARLLRGFRDAYDANRDATHLSAAWTAHAAAWRVELCRELATNASGCLPRRMPKLASDVAPDFLCSAEARRVLASYVWPHTSERDPARAAGVRRVCTGVPLHLGDLAAVVAAHFQWTSATLVQRFVRLVFPGVLVQELQRHAQTHDDARPDSCAAAATRTPRRAAAVTTSPSKGRRTAPSPTTSPVREITAYFARVQAHSPPRTRRASRVLQAHATRTTSVGTEVRVSYDPGAYLAQLPGAASADVQRVWVPERLLLAAGTPERAVYRTFEVQQRRKLASPSKKARAADQPALTAFFQVEKGGASVVRKEATRVDAQHDVVGLAGIGADKEPGSAARAPSAAPVPAVSPGTTATDVFGIVRAPPQRAPQHTLADARPPALPVAAPDTPDTSVEFVGMRAADACGETSVSSVESPRALLLRVCRPAHIS